MSTFGAPASSTAPGGSREVLQLPATGRSGGGELVLRRHLEWREFQITWRWLQDSYEGGNRFRNAIYGLDHRGLPVRNMVRHKREYPNPREQSLAATTFVQMPLTNPTMSAW